MFSSHSEIVLLVFTSINEVECTCLGLSADVLVDDELDRVNVLDLTPIALDASICNLITTRQIECL